MNLKNISAKFMPGNNKISIIIPCYPPDLNDLDQALTSLGKSTILPDEVIVALSETTKKEGIRVNKEFKERYNFPIIFLPTTKKQFAGQNRNRGLKIAKHDIILFFDADDLCHPQKLEITKYIFEKYQPKMFLHHFFIGIQPWGKYKLDELELRFSEQIFNYTFGNPPRRENANFIFTDRPSEPQWVGTGQPTHGHGAFHKSVFKKIKFTDLPRGQDAVFCLDVLWEFKSCVYAEANLICYIK